MSGPYILAIDQGTTGSTALVINFHKEALVVGRSTVEFTQYYPKPGWVEHDLQDIWQSVGQAVENAIILAENSDPQFQKSAIRCIGITNQRETLCAFEKANGKPAARAIVWQCRRTTDICKGIKRDSKLVDEITAKTGLVVDPYFSGTKIRWLMENNQDLANGANRGDILFGTIDTYLLYRLTGGAVYKTEPSNASRTMLFDIGKGQFDAGLCELMRVPSPDVLPEVVDSNSSFGETSGCGFLPDGIAITGMLGDQQAALAGQTCFEKGEAKCTYGTGAFLLLNTGPSQLNSSAGLLTTVCWSLAGELTYAFEGSAFIAGAAVQFIRDQLHLLDNASESEILATNKLAAPNLYFVPALAGLGAPIWNPDARGAFLGLTRGTGKGEIVRATLEGVALQVVDLVKAMDADFPGAIEILRVDGGACANALLMQIQANFLGIEVDRPVNLETTAFGAALFAGLGAGVFAGLDELKGLRQVDCVFTPEKDFDPTKILNGWQRAIGAVQVFGEAH